MVMNPPSVQHSNLASHSNAAPDASRAASRRAGTLTLPGTLTTARLKVSLTLDAADFNAIKVPKDKSRVTLRIGLPAEITAKSLRKPQAAIRGAGADNIVFCRAGSSPAMSSLRPALQQKGATRRHDDQPENQSWVGGEVCGGAVRHLRGKIDRLRRALAGFTTPTLDDMDFAINCLLVRPGRPRYPVLVHQAAALLNASSRRHLTTTPLRFANPSPSSGCIEDFHLQAVDQCLAHNKKAPPAEPTAPF
jgi:hypothetical protein